jgi:hypothetical protein
MDGHVFLRDFVGFRFRYECVRPRCRNFARDARLSRCGRSKVLDIVSARFLRGGIGPQCPLFFQSPATLTQVASDQLPSMGVKRTSAGDHWQGLVPISRVIGANLKVSIATNRRFAHAIQRLTYRGSVIGGALLVSYHRAQQSN